MKFKLLLLLNFICIAAFGQQMKVTGTVTSKELGTALAGVTVKSPSQTTVTDEKGKFIVTVVSGQTIVFNFVGMRPVNYTYDGRTESVNIQMDYLLGSLNEVVVTGYQTQKKADLTGAVGVLNTKDIKDVPLGNPLKAIQGRIPGVNITTDGTPDGGATVRIRGIGTLGNNDPLYIIDGVPTKRGLEQIDPNDIGSFQVLKDASSASIYGSRAANGVIIITTKKGIKGATKIDFTASGSLQEYQSKLKLLNSEQRGAVYWQAAINDGLNPNATSGIYQFDYSNVNGVPKLNKVIIPEYIDAAKTMKSGNTDWYKEVTQPSVIQSYDLTVSGGGERSNTLFGLSYYNSQGIVKDTYAKRYATRLNSDYAFLNDKVKIGENLGLNYIARDLLPTTGGDGILFNAYQVQPLVPVNTMNGGWGGPASGMTDKQNPVRQIEDNKQNRNEYARILGNIYIDIAPISGLHLKSSYGIDYTTAYQRTLRKSYVSGSLSDPSNQVATQQIYDGSLIWQNTVTYNLVLGKQKFDFLAGHEMIMYRNNLFYASRQGLAEENMDYAYLNAGSENIQNGGGGTKYGLQSFFGKVDYSLANKYLASATIRRDGSSRFGAKNQYGTFPAFSLGWRLSEEAFIKDNLPIISDLKLRYGYGVNGNQEIANNATYTLYQSIYGTDRTWDPDAGTAYDIAGANTGALPSGYVRTQFGNDSLKWETTKQHNFGVDFGLFGNQLNGSFDYFIKKTTGILVVPPNLGVVGGGTPAWINGASMQNKGFEFLLSYNGQFATSWHYSLTGNIAAYRNKVTNLPVNSLSAYPGNGTSQTILGRSINSFYGYVTDGLFTTQAQVANSPAQPGKGLGRIKYKDLNGDNVVNDQDQKFIGSSDPDFTYGLNLTLSYHQFDFALFLQGVSGGVVYNSFKGQSDFSSISAGANWGTRTLQAWSPQNPSSTIPALTLIDNNTESRLSTYFLEPESYWKLRNIQFGYTLKPRQNYVKSLRFYFQGNNLLTFKKKGFTGSDPEMPGFSYPIPAVFTLGLNASF